LSSPVPPAMLRSRIPEDVALTEAIDIHADSGAAGPPSLSPKLTCPSITMRYLGIEDKEVNQILLNEI
jgi:hypothetical protein